MRRRLRVGVGPLLGLLLAAGHAWSSTPEERWLLYEGAELSPAAATALQNRLQEEPRDLQARARLLGFLLGRSSWSPSVLGDWRAENAERIKKSLQALVRFHPCAAVTGNPELLLAGRSYGLTASAWMDAFANDSHSACAETNRLRHALSAVPRPKWLDARAEPARWSRVRISVEGAPPNGAISITFLSITERCGSYSERHTLQLGGAETSDSLITSLERSCDYAVEVRTTEFETFSTHVVAIGTSANIALGLPEPRQVEGRLLAAPILPGTHITFLYTGPLDPLLRTGSAAGTRAVLRPTTAYALVDEDGSFAAPVAPGRDVRAFLHRPDHPKIGLLLHGSAGPILLRLDETNHRLVQVE